LQDGDYSFNKTVVGPSDFGMPKSSLNELAVKDKLQSITETMRVIYGIRSNKSRENIVLLNSAAILLIGNIVDSFKDGLAIVKQSLDDGGPQKKLRSLINKYGDISKLDEAERLL
jgi:anthranilate phosphoribosyltransferase